MDFLTRQELNGLKGDKILSQETLEAEKFSFQKKLMDSMGKKMMEDLNNPPKRSFWIGLKYKYLRWKTIRDEKKRARKIKKGGF